MGADWGWCVCADSIRDGDGGHGGAAAEEGRQTFHGETVKVIFTVFGSFFYFFLTSSE